jgi:hypothetical protein
VGLACFVVLVVLFFWGGGGCTGLIFSFFNAFFYPFKTFEINLFLHNIQKNIEFKELSNKNNEVIRGYNGG